MKPDRSDLRVRPLIRSLSANALMALSLLVIFGLGHNALQGPLFRAKTTTTNIRSTHVISTNTAATKVAGTEKPPQWSRSQRRP